MQVNLLQAVGNQWVRLSLRMRLALLVLAMSTAIQITLSVVRHFFLERSIRAVSNESAAILNERIWLLVVTTPLGLIAAGFVGWLIAGKAVEPLIQLGNAAKEIGPATLTTGFDLPLLSSETIELQSQLNLALLRIDEAYERQYRFISNVSHELRTPIATLLTESQTLGDLDQSPKDVQRFVESCQNEMRRLGRVVESFLMLSLLHDGQSRSLQGRCSVNDFVLESIGNNRKLASARNIRIIPHLVEIEDGTVAEVIGDSELLCSMLENIIRNAIRFSPLESSIQVNVSELGATLEISVIDEGPGIPDELMTTIFDRYSFFCSNSDVPSGMGIGLSIAKGVAELHGGNISVRNRPNAGCEFFISLPRHFASSEKI